MAKEANPCRVITPEARLSFPALFKPAKPMAEGQPEKYQCELIFPKTTDLTPLKVAATLAIKNKWADKPPKNLRTPFRDGSERESDGYTDCVFFSARSKDKPGVITGPNRDVIMPENESDVYGGCYVRVSVTAFAYDAGGNRGVAFALNNVWKIRDGEPFGSRRNAEDEFESVDVDPEAFGGDTVSSLL